MKAYIIIYRFYEDYYIHKVFLDDEKRARDYLQELQTLLDRHYELERHIIDIRGKVYKVTSDIKEIESDKANLELLYEENASVLAKIGGGQTPNQIVLEEADISE